MKCQTCQTRSATVHFTDISDTGLKEYHLCEECYAVQKPQGTDMIGMIASALSSPPSRSADDPMPQTCPQCSLTYATFRSRGRLGCPNCYETFRPALEPLLEKIHGGKVHMGKTPLDPGTRDRGRNRLVISLRRKLQEAIHQESYELAASLRDELHKAEQAAPEAEAPEAPAATPGKASGAPGDAPGGAG